MSGRISRQIRFSDEKGRRKVIRVEGLRWDERNLRRGFYRCLDKAGIRQVRFHDLRHTYASLMAQAGAPPKYVQKQLGHSSFQVTMDVYSHVYGFPRRLLLRGPALVGFPRRGHTPFGTTSHLFDGIEGTKREIIEEIYPIAREDHWWIYPAASMGRGFAL